MNLKPNLWTLLFVLVAGGWFWNTFLSDSLPAGPRPKVVNDKDSTLLRKKSDLEIIKRLSKYEITPEEYKKNRQRYVDLAQNCLQTKCLAVQHTGHSYYKIHRDEINEFSKLDTGGYLYLIPIIEDIINKGECESALTLAFTKEEPEIDGAIKELGINEKIYNFATPCPPLCHGEQALTAFCKD